MNFIETANARPHSILYEHAIVVFEFVQLLVAVQHNTDKPL